MTKQMATVYYKVEDVDDMGASPCRCGSCGWTGPANETAAIESCALTPGDASPVGRCPDKDCGALCYLDRPEDRRQANADRLHSSLQQLVGLVERACAQAANGGIDGNLLGELRAASGAAAAVLVGESAPQ